MSIYGKIYGFLNKVDGRSYTTKSLSKVLHVKHETARKYLRHLVYEGSVKRFKEKGTYRYYVV
jgi:Fic family protein